METMKYNYNAVRLSADEIADEAYKNHLGGGREDWVTTLAPLEVKPWTMEQFRESLIGWLDIGRGIPPDEIA